MTTIKRICSSLLIAMGVLAATAYNMPTAEAGNKANNNCRVNGSKNTVGGTSYTCSFYQSDSGGDKKGGHKGGIDAGVILIDIHDISNILSDNDIAVFENSFNDSFNGNCKGKDNCDVVDPDVEANKFFNHSAVSLQKINKLAQACLNIGLNVYVAKGKKHGKQGCGGLLCGK